MNYNCEDSNVAELNQKNIPNHIGIIMDGNGRWANLRGKSRSAGHKEGSKNVNRIVEYAFKKGVKTLSLFAFSSENWARPKEEVDGLMKLLELYFKKFLNKLIKNNVKLSIMGDTSVLPENLQKTINNTIEKSKHCDGFNLVVGINYGARQEIVHAVKMLLQKGEEISEKSILDNLYTSSFGEPDLIIRTGGELRLSNFMLYQGAYSELYFSDVLWPDFHEEHFDLALESFSKRKRRFGKV